MLFVLTKHTVARIFSDPPCAQVEMHALERKLAMIREGILIPGEEKKNV